MFGVLEVILRRDPVPGQSFGAREGQITFIVSLVVLNIPRLGTRVPRRFISLGGLGCSRHGVRHNLCIWACLRSRGFKFYIVFHIGPYASGRCRTTLIGGICRVGRRGEGSDQALMGARSRARHWINNISAGRTDPESIDQIDMGGPSRDFKLLFNLSQMLTKVLLNSSPRKLSYLCPNSPPTKPPISLTGPPPPPPRLWRASAAPRRPADLLLRLADASEMFSLSSA
jgi:hypothetical protein